MSRPLSKRTSIEANRLLVSRLTRASASKCLYVHASSRRARFGSSDVLGYPPAVRRLLYTCLAVAIAGSSMTPRSLHVHVSAGHSHQEHEHGLASHEHHRQVPDPARRHLQLSSCDPATHAVFLSHTFKAFSATTTYAIATLTTERLTVASPRVERYQPPARIEARQHGPPGKTPVSPRPPPSTQSA